MRTYLSYYIKKYWYLLVLLLVLIVGALIITLNSGDLISYFDKYNNKVDFEPDNVQEEQIDADKYLDGIDVEPPYIGTSLRPYIPSAIDGTPEEDEYLNNLEKDPNFMYKKNISWASGSVTIDQLTELIELVGYHVNKGKTDVSIFVNLPTVEQMSESGKEVLYYTDDKGVLYLNLYVEEINKNTNTKKSYNYTYSLQYDMYGKITIR